MVLHVVCIIICNVKGFFPVNLARFPWENELQYLYTKHTLYKKVPRYLAP